MAWPLAHAPGQKGRTALVNGASAGIGGSDAARARADDGRRSVTAYGRSELPEARERRHGCGPCPRNCPGSSTRTGLVVAGLRHAATGCLGRRAAGGAAVDVRTRAGQAPAGGRRGDLSPVGTPSAPVRTAFEVDA